MDANAGNTVRGMRKKVLTMAEYINRDDLLKAAWDKPTLSLSVYDIGNIKPVDVVPVRHARWECGKPCPVCGGDRFEGLDADIWADWEPPYCPNCGAKMDLEG